MWGRWWGFWGFPWWGFGRFPWWGWGWGWRRWWW